MRRLLAVLLPLLLTPTVASALNPAMTLQDYHHTSWTAKDGAPTNVESMAQTSDGWLWLASKSGLHRFDGVRFERYELPGAANPIRRRPSALRALPNGDLLMSFFMGGGLSVLHPDGSMEDLAEPGKEVAPFNGLTYDDNGEIWLSNIRGIQRRIGGKWQTLDAAHGLPRGQMEDIKLDRHGQLWALSTSAAYLYDRASDKFEKFRGLPDISTLISSPDGRMWISNSHGAQALPIPPGSVPRLPRKIDIYSDWSAQFDRDGNLWALKCPTALCLVPHAGSLGNTISPAAASSRMDQQWQMSSLNLTAILEDREGNIWIATKAGLERFRDIKLAAVAIPSPRSVFSLSKDGDGQIWAVDGDGGAWKLTAGKAPVVDRTQHYVTSAIDRNGDLLLATPTEIVRRGRDGVESIPLPLPPGSDGKPHPIKVWGIQDDGKVLWMASPQTGLMGWVDGAWRPRSKFKLPPGFVLGTPDRPGESWIASADGAITLSSGQRQLPYKAATIGLPTGMFVGEQIIAAGDQGVAVFTGQRFHPLSAQDPDVLRNVSGLAVTSNGDRWLNGGKGLLHVRKQDWLASMARPTLPLRYQLMSVHDGYRGEAVVENRLPSMLVDRDDRLWFAGTGGIMQLDTRNILRNPVAPVPTVTGIATLDGKQYNASGKLQLPAGARSFNIHYTAPSLRQPEAIRFQYRLSGIDGDWREATPRRTAYYTDIPPGSYQFQVRAANEDGLWSAQPANVTFEIPPTIPQTWWFKALCVLAATATLYLLYWYRLRIVTRRLEERMEVRLAERERIARTLHDTFLQSVQGVVLRLDAAVDTLPDDSAARKSLTHILHSARDSISEGRAQVHELRTTDVDDVEISLRDIAPLLAASYPGAAFSLTVSGKRIPLCTGVVEDICEIGREAVRNAFQHAHASSIEVLLDYQEQQFTLRVRDDGTGMSPAPATGHWGLVGMRERAARIGAALEISSEQSIGCGVTVTLSARRAYAGRRPPWWSRLLG
ncbi:hypothetical protein KW842_03700 [Duganella sp. sic0402]|uniref:sensor histidine kinase n=1 Tax=Duganella sp. sic0402 TaxID=2854786 RepID=UPI001C4816A9|nr:sensor histidine kinase [Duganella sp. sic0402]MBV7534866.1 hypothetical protein [Duganella sp. sic0402]